MDTFQQGLKCIVICGCESINEGMDSLNYYKRKDIEAIYRKNKKIFYDYHIHCNTINIGIILQGNLLLENEGDKITLSPERVFCIMPFCLHRLSSDNNCSLVMFSITLGTFIQKGNNVLLHDIKDILLYYNIFCNKTILSNVEKLLSNINVNSDYIIELERKKDYVKLLEETETLDEMADLMNYSKYHFLRKFKSVTKITPHKLKQIRMIRKAQEMFNTGRNTAEVIRYLNYCDQSHFIKQFKYVVGVTPTEYIDAIKRANRETNIFIQKMALVKDSV